MPKDLPVELDNILAHLILFRPTSRDDMKSQLSTLLAEYEVVVMDSHNTASVIFKFKAADIWYGLKIEYGRAQVLRDEAHWYALAPEELKTHFVISHMADSYAFVLLRWLVNARTIEQIAIANEDNQENVTIPLVLQVLERDKVLFESNPTVPLLADKQTGYFIDKYEKYNSEAKDYPYLLQLLNEPVIRINGSTLPGPNRLVEQIHNDPHLVEYLTPNQAGLIHGDTHMDNVLVEEGAVYFIDPKGIDHLPIEYDTGRVLWSLTGWNAIVNGEFTLEETDEGYKLDIVRRRQYLDGMGQVREFFGDQNYHRAMYAAAMQYMCRVSHAHVQPEATGLYLAGLELMGQLLDELGVQPKV